MLLYFQPHRTAPIAAPNHAELRRSSPSHASAAPSHADSHRTAPARSRRMSRSRSGSRSPYTSRSYSCSRERYHRSSSRDSLSRRSISRSRHRSRSLSADHLEDHPPTLGMSHMSDNFSPTLLSWQPIHLRSPGSRIRTSPAVSLRLHQASPLTVKSVDSTDPGPLHGSTVWQRPQLRQSHRPDSVRRPFYVDRPFERVCRVSGHPKATHAAQVPHEVPCPTASREDHDTL